MWENCYVWILRYSLLQIAYREALTTGVCLGSLVPPRTCFQPVSHPARSAQDPGSLVQQFASTPPRPFRIIITTWCPMTVYGREGPCRKTRASGWVWRGGGVGRGRGCLFCGSNCLLLRVACSPRPLRALRERRAHRGVWLSCPLVCPMLPAPRGPRRCNSLRW